tara:strand:- start:117 stop:815 length:699 start_codon:yes stop_codon:yes gene_type:complete
MAKKQKLHITDDEMKKLHKNGTLEKEDITITFGTKDVSNDKNSTESELEELVDFDGSVLGSKVPLGYMNNKTISQRKTTDAVVPATRQGGEQGKGYFYKRYWGESVEEVKEEDISGVLGIDSDEDGVVDTDLMSRDEVVDMFEKVYDMSEIEANERADKSGAIKGNKKRIFEDEDIMNMLEVILNSKDEPKEIKDKEEDETDDSMLNRKIDQLKKYITSKGYSIEDVLKKLK